MRKSMETSLIWISAFRFSQQAFPKWIYEWNASGFSCICYHSNTLFSCADVHEMHLFLNILKLLGHTVQLVDVRETLYVWEDQDSKDFRKIAVNISHTVCHYFVSGFKHNGNTWKTISWGQRAAFQFIKERTGNHHLNFSIFWFCDSEVHLV